MPVTRTMITAGTAPIPPFSIIQASIIQPIATKEPTLISIPPVIITTVMPIPITISPALDINRFKKFCVLEKPCALNSTQPIPYIIKNSKMVTSSRKLFCLISFYLSCHAASFPAFISFFCNRDFSILQNLETGELQ